jgi:hypothetical protein
MKKFFAFLSLIILFSGAVINAQVGINTENPSPNSALHIVAPNNDKGVILPQIPSDVSLNEVVTSGQLSDGTPFDADGLVLYNLQTGCFNYYKQSNSIWYSLCGTPPPAIGTINCTDGIEHIGVYIEKRVFNINNYLRVKINVASPGTYSITAMPRTSNGYYFSGSGVFPQAGTHDVLLSGAGTPTNPVTDEIDFVFNGNAQNCGYQLSILEGTPDFCIINARQIPSTPWTIGQIFNTSSAPSDLRYYAEVTLHVNKPGPYTIAASEQNGYDFMGTGQLYQASGYNPNGNFPQTVTVNIPVVAGKQATANNPNTNTFQLTSTGQNLCQTLYPLTITLAEIAFSVDCSGIVLNNFGTIMQGQAIPDASTITMQVTVTSAGSTQITANFAGLSFSTGASLGTPGEVTLSTGVHNVTLYPVTSGQKPNQAGQLPISIISSKGGYSRCASPKEVTVIPATATFREIKITAFTNGNQYIMTPYAGGADVPCDIMLSVQADVAGEYNLSTTVNGVTWAGTGNIPAGTSTITLKPVSPTTNRPISSGAKSVSLSYTKITGGVSTAATTNSQNVYFVQRSINVLCIGRTTYNGYSTSHNSGKFLRSSKNFGPTGTVTVKSLTLYSGGTSPEGNSLKNAINANKADIIIVGYAYNPNSTSVKILKDFVNNKGGALIYSQEVTTSTVESLISEIFGSSSNFSDSQGTVSTLISDASDPIINGPFQNLGGLQIGTDFGSSSMAATTSLPSSLKALGSLTNGNVNIFYSTSKGFFFCGDAGWLAGHPSVSTERNDIYPFQLNSDDTPKPKAYSGGTMVYNSALFGNVMAWAIDWAVKNCNVNYIIP